MFNDKMTIIKEIFYILTAALLLFTGLEMIWPRVVLAYINLSWVLLIWFIIGIFIIVKTDKNKLNSSE